MVKLRNTGMACSQRYRQCLGKKEFWCSPDASAASLAARTLGDQLFLFELRQAQAHERTLAVKVGLKARLRFADVVQARGEFHKLDHMIVEPSAFGECARLFFDVLKVVNQQHLFADDRAIVALTDR